MDFSPTNPLPGVPLVESTFFDALLPEFAPDPETKRIATDLHTHGYAVLDFPDPDFDRRASAIRTTMYDRYDWDTWRRENYAKGEGLRVQDAWATNAEVRALAANQGIIDLLSRLYGRPARPFQSLCFPVGTQQPFHTDAAHFSSVPERFMCGVWVALENITADAGPLVYYPGSHRWPIYDNASLGTSAWGEGNIGAYARLWQNLVQLHGVKPKRFLARRGQALIWAANLLHGGDRQTNPERTRWSQVTHYFFDGCAYHTPFFSDPFLGSIAFRRPADIRTGDAMQNMLAGYPIDPAFVTSASDRSMRMRRAVRPDAKVDKANAAASNEEPIVARPTAAEAELAEARLRIAALENSRSWRITAPLRVFAQRRRH